MISNITQNKYVRIITLMIIDALIVAVSSQFSLVMRFGTGAVPAVFYMNVLHMLAPDIVITIVVFLLFRLYHRVWSFASIDEIINVFEATTFATLIEVLYKSLLSVRIPRSVLFTTYLLTLVLMLLSRLSIRILAHYRFGRRQRKRTRRTMIVGAGSAGSLLFRELMSQYGSDNQVVCLIDDNKQKWGKYLHGCRIEGGKEHILASVKKHNVEEIIIAIPSASQDVISEMIDVCRKTDCRIRILPSIALSLHGSLASNVRDISYEDFLSRDPVEVNDEGIDRYIQDKVVMITGGGGSIGAELCRQVAMRKPKKLIILDIYENNAYGIQMELLQTYHDTLDMEAVIASVRDHDRMEAVFREYRPEIVFHAAAHKHVPLMEVSPNEAIKNNCFGTLNTAMLADQYGVDKFVLISTDKAVRPTSMMGASKRICEMIIQDMARKAQHTTFAAVRFGNVLGSNGSVIPLFLQQIEEGGPVTVTHREITRFFMTIPEAVSLVMQAGEYAKGGEIFVLDMGEQVKIYDLAESLIRMKGFRPNEDIKIEITGLRPGEKLYEEVLMDEEGMEMTANRKIFIGHPIQMDYDVFETKLSDLIDAAFRNVPDIKERTRVVCDTYVITDNDSSESEGEGEKPAEE